MVLWGRLRISNPQSTMIFRKPHKSWWPTLCNSALIVGMTPEQPIPIGLGSLEKRGLWLVRNVLATLMRTNSGNSSNPAYVCTCRLKKFWLRVCIHFHNSTNGDQRQLDIGDFKRAVLVSEQKIL